MNIATIILLLIACITAYLKIRKIQKDINAIAEENAIVKTDFELLQKKFNSLKGQMFVHEGILLQEKGKWCLECNGEKKYFTPGKIEKIISPDIETEFVYDNGFATCTCRKNGIIVSKITYKTNGAPVAGTVYENGTAVREFKYDELGQVCEENNI